MTGKRTAAGALPQGFEDLTPFLGWNLETPDERQAKRRQSSTEELRVFYHSLLPRMNEILERLGRYELGRLPETDRTLFNLALALAEIAPNVELYDGDPGVPYSFEEDRMIAAHGRQPTWRGLPPMAAV